jgi:glycosyltransferase involved in cell wall biosynthesis
MALIQQQVDQIEQIRISQEEVKVVFLRGVNFSQEIGASDWRIGLCLPEFGFHAYIFGRGMCSSALPAGVEIFAPKASGWPIIGALQLFITYFLKLWQVSPAIVICNPGIFLLGNFYKLARPHIKLILDIRSTPVESRGVTSRWQHLAFRLSLRSPWYDGISVITTGMLAELRRDFGLNKCLPTAIWGSAYDDKIFTAPLAQHVPAQMQALQGKFILMFHGSLSPNRGLDQVIRCLHILNERNVNDVVLVLIGKGAAHSQLVQLAAEQQVSAQVICLPPMPHLNLPGYVACADLGLDPLPDHPWWRNQSALKVYEYLAMGKPVLATDLPCHRNISEAVLLLPDNRPETIAEAILNFRGLTAENQASLHQTALTDSRRHTWRARARSLACFLRSDILKESR